MSEKLVSLQLFENKVTVTYMSIELCSQFSCFTQVTVTYMFIGQLLYQGNCDLDVHSPVALPK